MLRGPLYRDGDIERACLVGESGRLAPEDYRSPWRRDFARLVHCPAFRRLQGKMQLFPSDENDFYRTRLTHSLEVAQVAKSIAVQLNDRHSYFKDQRVETDIVEFAALAHDLGHPPFGHNGEAVLDLLMREHGGFEGNAQTLRLLARLEKKQTETFPASGGDASPVVEGKDIRCGLNLTARCLASILKYDNEIPPMRDAEIAAEKGPVKGFYFHEQALVDKIRQNVVGDKFSGKFKTIECSIMDVADDIAYSTYDLEDSLKAGFLSPLDILSAEDAFKRSIAAKVSARIAKSYGDLPASEKTFGVDEFNTCVLQLFSNAFDIDEKTMKRVEANEVSFDELTAILVTNAYTTSSEMAKNGYYRTDYSSTLVGTFIRDIEVIPHKDHPEMPQVATVRLPLATFKQVELLKMFCYDRLIMSPRWKLADHRGSRVIETIFESLEAKDGYRLMPDDWGSLYEAINDTAWRKRVICDFISGMTDRYCVEFYERITGSKPPSFHKPH